LLTDEHLHAGYAFSWADPFHAREVPRQDAGVHQRADLGAELVGQRFTARLVWLDGDMSF
jgi:hypothetical protein